MFGSHQVRLRLALGPSGEADRTSAATSGPDAGVPAFVEVCGVVGETCQAASEVAVTTDESALGVTLPSRDAVQDAASSFHRSNDGAFDDEHGLEPKPIRRARSYPFDVARSDLGCRLARASGLRTSNSIVRAWVRLYPKGSHQGMTMSRMAVSASVWAATTSPRLRDIRSPAVSWLKTIS